jgi:hypothetical protein
MEGLLRAKWSFVFLAVPFLIIFEWIAYSKDEASKPLWGLTRSFETRLNTPNPFVFLIASDLNQNGVKELVVNDFGFFHTERIHSDSFEEMLQDKPPYHLFVLEWNGKEVSLSWNSQIGDYSVPYDDGTERVVRVREVTALLMWKVGKKTVLEAFEPLFALEPKDGSYSIIRQIGVGDRTIGSFALPWLTPTCYGLVKETWPQECLLGIRDFRKDGNPKIITRYEEKGENEKYTDWLRVRKMEPGFPIEWEQKLSERFRGGMAMPDPFNGEATGGLFFRIRNPRGDLWWLVELNPAKGGYQIQPTKLQFDKYISGRVGRTQHRDREEIWVYLIDKGTDKYAIRTLQQVTVKSDLSGLIKENIDFPHHEPYLGVEQFVLGDLDGDSLDELVLVEATGKREWADEAMHYSDTKEYIHILKGDGKGYKTVWVSPPYNKRGTRLLIADIKKSGRKQLIVGTGDGRIQIWEKQ